MESIFGHMDYRLYLRKTYEALKQKNKNFSYRSFNRLAGISSSSFLKHVMDGKRNLAADGICKTARGLQLSDMERQYFETLVKFNQAHVHEDKDRYYKDLLQHKEFKKAKPMAEAQYRSFSHWYYAAILELVKLPADGIKNAAWIQSKLKPVVELRTVNQAVKELKGLKLLKAGKKGGLVSTEEMIATPDEVKSLSVKNFHSQMSELASRSVLKDGSDEREFSSLTIAVSNKGFEIIKKEIRAFRKKLHSLLENESSQKTKVAQVNLQLFSLNER